MKQLNWFWILFSIWLLSLDHGWWMAAFFFLLTGSQRHQMEVWIVLLLSFRMLIPFSPDIPDQFQGRVIRLYDNSVLIENKGVRYQLITETRLTLDDWVEVEANWIETEDSSHFFAFDTHSYRLQNRIAGLCEARTLKVLQSSKSWRGWLQKKIETQPEALQPALFQLVLNQGKDDSSFLAECGFHYAMLLRLITGILGYFFKEDTVKRAEVFFTLFLLLILYFPMALVRIFFFLIFQKDGKRKSCLPFYGLLVYLFHPPLLHSLAFLIPVGLMLIPHDRSSRILFLVLIQSYFFYECHWISFVVFRWIQRAAAILSLLGWLQLITDLPFFTYSMHALEPFLQLESEIMIGLGKIPTFLFGIGLFHLFSSLKKKRTMGLLGVCFVLLTTGWVFPWAEVSVINVGQGDSLLIRLPLNRANILIDTGKKSASDKVLQFLKARGIRHLDALILTHQDEDHCGGKDILMEQMEIKEIIERYQEPFCLDSFCLVFLGPLKDYEEENDNSLILAFSLNGLDFLLMGDASSQAEKDLIQTYGRMHFDFVKIGHHGSHTSTSLAFLNSVSFSTALISSGVNNPYQHPDPLILKRLFSYGIAVLNTQQQGDITIGFTHFFNFLITSNQEFGIIKKVMK